MNNNPYLILNDKPYDKFCRVYLIAIQVAGTNKIASHFITINGDHSLKTYSPAADPTEAELATNPSIIVKLSAGDTVKADPVFGAGNVDENPGEVKSWISVALLYTV